MSKSNTTASLGCGSIILIVILFMIFGRTRGHGDMERELTKLRREVGVLQDTVDALHDSGTVNLSPEELQQILAKTISDSEQKRVRELLPKYRAIYAEFLSEDPFNGADPETMEELLAPMREIIEGISADKP
ncbi:MAG: hypothetical protein O3A92_09640 [Verrucomicrobia bacterium]|nr:hypothetical protein [Verrucomicrobiota bacterium]